MNKKKILLLGGHGMLGSALFLSFLDNTDKFIIKATVRDNKKLPYKKKGHQSHLINNCDVSNFNQIEKIIDNYKPNYVINCIGITNKKVSRNSNHYIFKINSFLPIYLSQLSAIKNFKFIHISTDCVFEGKEKLYFEDSFKTAKDIYGISKSLGEEIDHNKNSLILRTSIIGHELKKKEGLLEWFLSQKKVSGYHNVFYSGVTTIELSKIIIKIIKSKNIYGLYQISSKKISKLKLLHLINKIYNLKIIIKKNIKIKKMLVLNSDKFKKKTNINVKKWDEQIKEMKKFYVTHQLPIIKNFIS
jgi:dTDP-4-dehydrorhamnose reductase